VFLTIIFSVLLILVICILLIPMVLYINTITNQYYLQAGILAKASLEGDQEELVRIRLRVLFLNFSFYPLKKSTTKKKKESTSVQTKKRKSIGFNKAIRIIKSFKVKKFWLNIDTGNCISNAKLYPAFAFLNYRVGGFHINFEGKNQLVLQLQNRPIYFIKSFINF